MLAAVLLLTLQRKCDHYCFMFHVRLFFFFFFFDDIVVVFLFRLSPSWVEDMLDVLLIFTSLLTSELMWIDLYSQSLLLKNTLNPFGLKMLHHVWRISYVARLRVHACTWMWSSSVVIIFSISILLTLFGGARRAARGARRSNPHGHSMCEGSFNWKSVRSSSWSDETDKANCWGN